MKLRRFMAIGMTVALTATMFSGVSVYAESSDPEPFKIGFPWDTANTDPTWISIYNNVKAAVESAGGELVNVVTDNSADGLIDNISELISRDVDGILFMPASDSMLPAVDAMCADAGVQCSVPSVITTFVKLCMIQNGSQAAATKMMRPALPTL